MSDFLYKDLLSELPQGTELTKSDTKNIYKLFPVPSDFKILWASVEAFGGHPCGVVVTDKAFIIKGSFKGVKSINKEQAKKAKDNKEKYRKIDTLYQIVLWEHFDAEDFSIIKGSDDSYSIEYASTKYPNFSKECLANKFIEKAIAKSKERRLAAEAAVANAAVNAIGFESVVFAAAYGAATSNTGHGIYAEEAGAILDKLHREKVEVVGRDNAKNGPDKLVNGNPVQCKYCNSVLSTLIRQKTFGHRYQSNWDQASIRLRAPATSLVGSAEPKPHITNFSP